MDFDKEIIVPIAGAVIVSLAAVLRNVWERKSASSSSIDLGDGIKYSIYGAKEDRERLEQILSARTSGSLVVREPLVEDDLHLHDSKTTAINGEYEPRIRVLEERLIQAKSQFDYIKAQPALKAADSQNQTPENYFDVVIETISNRWSSNKARRLALNFVMQFRHDLAGRDQLLRDLVGQNDALKDVVASLFIAFDELVNPSKS